MSHWCCACHTTSHCNVPFPAPATQSHAPTLPGCFNHLPPNVALVPRLPRNVTLQRTCNVFPAPATQTHTPTLPGCFNRLRLPPNVTLVFAPQRHTATHPSLHQPPRATLQRYQDASITCHQMSHWCCGCHTTSHCNVHANVPFPAPATQSHAPTLPGCFNRLRLPPNVTLVLRLPHNVTIQRTIPCTSHTESTLQLEVSRAQASQFHVYKRANFTCTSEPAPFPLPTDRGQLRPYPNSFLLRLPRNCLALHVTGSAATLPSTQR